MASGSISDIRVWLLRRCSSVCTEHRWAFIVTLINFRKSERKEHFSGFRKKHALQNTRQELFSHLLFSTKSIPRWHFQHCPLCWIHCSILSSREWRNNKVNVSWSRKQQKQNESERENTCLDRSTPRDSPKPSSGWHTLYLRESVVVFHFSN